MPGGDRTGPMGMGSMTGRAAGYCAGYPVPGFMNPVGGRGFGGGGWGRGGGGGGWGRGGGRGWRHGYYATGLPGWAGAGWGAAPYGGAPAAGYAPWAGAPAAGYAAWGGAPAAGYAPWAGAAAPTRDVQLDSLKAQAEYLENSLAEIRKRVGELEAEETPSESERRNRWLRAAQEEAAAAWAAVKAAVGAVAWAEVAVAAWGVA